MEVHANGAHGTMICKYDAHGKHARGEHLGRRKKEMGDRWEKV